MDRFVPAHRSARVSGALAMLAVLLTLAACGAADGAVSSSDSAQTSTPAATPDTTSSAGPASLGHDCTETAPCAMVPGRYALDSTELLDGLALTVPAGWSSLANNPGEFKLQPPPPASPDDKMFFWVDLRAVKSTGNGHGTTVLDRVGGSAGALVHWLTTNTAFAAVAPPTTETISGRTMRVLTLGVSSTARYGDADCPDNPRCADLFTYPTYWNGESYGIGGPEVARVYLGSFTTDGKRRTFLIALDAVNQDDLKVLTTTARPILDSIGLPTQ